MMDVAGLATKHKATRRGTPIAVMVLTVFIYDDLSRLRSVLMIEKAGRRANARGAIRILPGKAARSLPIENCPTPLDGTNRPKTNLSLCHSNAPTNCAAVVPAEKAVEFADVLQGQPRPVRCQDVRCCGKEEIIRESPDDDRPITRVQQCQAAGAEQRTDLAGKIRQEFAPEIDDASIGRKPWTDRGRAPSARGLRRR